jgi:hypothetical protein
MKAVMLDLETLGTRPECAILTLGAIKFDPFKVDSFGASLYLRINIDEQIAIGREVQQETLDWWAKQDSAVRDEALSDNDRVSLEDATRKLNKFLVGVETIWAQGPVFDIAILENLYRQLGKPIPWNFWQIRDSRTLFGVHGDPRVKGRAGHHDALADCIYQAQGVQQIYQKQNIIKPEYS